MWLKVMTRWIDKRLILIHYALFTFSIVSIIPVLLYYEKSSWTFLNIILFFVSENGYKIYNELLLRIFLH